MRILFSLFILSVLTMSCKKNNEAASAIEISFIEPVVGDTIASWNQIHVEGTIVAKGDMTGYKISILKQSDNSILFEKTYDIKAPAYNFHDHWMNNLYDTTSVIVKVDAFSSNEANNLSKTINVVCLP